MFQWLCRATPLLNTVHSGIEISATLFAVKLMTANVQRDRAPLLGNTTDLPAEARFDSFLRTSTLRTVLLFFVVDFKSNWASGEYFFN